MTLSIPPALRRHQRSVLATASADVSRLEALEARRLLAVTVDAGGPYSFTETDDNLAVVLTLNAAASGATGTANFTWDLNDDGVFNDGTGAMLALSSGSLASLGINQHRATPYPIHVKVQDDTGTATDDAELTVLNAPPQVDLFVSTEGGFTEGNTLDVNPSVTKDMFAPADASYTYVTVVTLDGVELAPNNDPVPSPIGGALGVSLNYTLPDDGAALQIVTTVTDEDGGSTTVHWPASGTQAVANAPISLNPLQPAPSGLTAGQSFDVGVVVSATSVDTITYRWRLIHVTASGPVAVVDETTFDSIYSFTPAVAGTYFWQSNVSDDDGSTDARRVPNFTVLPAVNEQATTIYTGQEYVTTASPTSNTATVALRAVVTDADGIGDISRATVTFFNNETLEDLVTGVSVAALTGSTSSGVAAAPYTYTLATGETELLSVGVRIDEGNIYVAPVSFGIITISQPDAGRVIAGGSVLNTGSSGGLLAGAEGTRTSFGFHARAHPQTGAIDGAVELIFSSDVTLGDSTVRHTFRAEGSAITSLDVRTVDGVRQARIAASVDVYDVTDALNPVLVQPGAWLELTAADVGKRGAVAFSLWAQAGGPLLPGGGLLFANNWVNGQSVLEELSAGNLKIWDY